MLQNAYFRAKIGADTAENEQHFFFFFPSFSFFLFCQYEQHFAEILPKIGNPPSKPDSSLNSVKSTDFRQLCWISQNPANSVTFLTKIYRFCENSASSRAVANLKSGTFTENQLKTCEIIRTTAYDEFGAVQKYVNREDPGECCKTRLYLQNVTSTQP